VRQDEVSRLRPPERIFAGGAPHGLKPLGLGEIEGAGFKKIFVTPSLPFFAHGFRNIGFS